MIVDTRLIEEAPASKVLICTLRLQPEDHRCGLFAPVFTQRCDDDENSCMTAIGTFKICYLGEHLSGWKSQSYSRVHDFENALCL